MSKDIPGTPTPAPKAPDVVQPQKPRSEMTEAMADLLKTLLPEAMNGAAAAALSLMQQQGYGNAAAARPAPAANTWNGERCSECNQLLRACKGEHDQMVVFPNIEEFGQYFQGVFINGVRYLSNNGGHAISVPKGTEIKYLVKKWEENEASIRLGRSKEHHSGTLNNFQKTNAIGFR